MHRGENLGSSETPRPMAWDWLNQGRTLDSKGVKILSISETFCGSSKNPAGACWIFDPANPLSEFDRCALER